VKYNVLLRWSIVASDLHFVVKFPERNEVDIFGTLNVGDGTEKTERWVCFCILEIIC
jgi:hypothetical protein